MLRPYQQAAHDAVIDWVRATISPCLIDAATGAGKSHIIAAIAETIHKTSKGKRILCLAPSAELVEQNFLKYIATGAKASIFSASAGAKCLRHPVVFGTPGTVKNRISRFRDEFAAVVIDEAHGMTPTVLSIIEAMQSHNDNLRVIGLTATPYRMNTGFIYAVDWKNKPVRADQTIDPYFSKCVYRITARELIDQGYLTEPVIGEINGEHYDTMGMEVNARGQFDKADVDRAYHGQGRKTAAIVADVIRQSQGRMGVMLFAATIEHAREVMASLPPELSRMVDGSTSKAMRKQIVADFKAQRFKYLVNVAVFTTGFDAAHVDVIALLRKTESAGLLQQIIGRGLRLHDDKNNCLVLDYAENVEYHFPDGDIFNPDIKTRNSKSGDAEPVRAVCELCNTENQFSPRPNTEGFVVDENGYFIDLAGFRIKGDHGFIPAHFGRRCTGLVKQGKQYVQCDYRWTYKECPHCGVDNDIAARKCHSCGGEIVDPNEKLRADFKALKKDPTRMQTDKVLDWEVKPTLSRAGNECLRISVTTEYRKFTYWIVKNSRHKIAQRREKMFINETNNGEDMPRTITYKKDPESGLYDVTAYNLEPDTCEIT